jgi:hypothetical protein
MKKATMCIGFFIVLFLAVGVYTVQAVVADGLNGTWLKFTGSLKGMEFAEGPGSEEAGRNDNDSIKLYGCVVDGPFFDNQFFVQFYEKASAATPAGVGVFEKKAGTADKFAGWFTMNLMEGYVPATPDIYTDTISVPGEMTIKRNNLGNINKINFKGFGGHGEKRPTNPPGPYTGYALYGVKKLNGQSATAKSLPFDENTACPSGYVIQVTKESRDGTHIGIITYEGTNTEAGFWVPVAAGASQGFTVTTTVNGTSIYVYVDGSKVYEDASAQDAGLTYTYTFPVVSANHSFRVEFD